MSDMLTKKLSEAPELLLDDIINTIEELVLDPGDNNKLKRVSLANRLAWLKAQRATLGSGYYTALFDITDAGTITTNAAALLAQLGLESSLVICPYSLQVNVLAVDSEFESGYPSAMTAVPSGTFSVTATDITGQHPKLNALVATWTDSPGVTYRISVVFRVR